MMAYKHQFKTCVLVTATVCFALCGLDVRGEELIVNGGFESYTGMVGHSGNWDPISSNLSLDGWACGWENGAVGLTKDSGTWVKSGIGVVDGSYALYFQKVSSITQTINVAMAGSLEISFSYVARPNSSDYYRNGVIHVEVDGVEIGAVNCSTNYDNFLEARFAAPIGAGRHAFVIRHDPSNNANACSAIDAVSVNATSNLVLNGGFELGTVGSNHSGNWAATTETGFENPHWNWNDGSMGLAKPGSAWAASTISGADTYMMYFQTVNCTYKGVERKQEAASLWQSFEVTQPGVYELAFSHARRTGGYKDGTIRARVYEGSGTGGAVKGEFTVATVNKTAFDEFSGTVKLLAPGTYTLEFYAPQPEYNPTTLNEADSIIDNVSFSLRRTRCGLAIRFL